MKRHQLKGLGLCGSPNDIVQLELGCNDKTGNQACCGYLYERDGVMMASMEYTAWIWHDIAYSIARIELDSS